MDKKYFSISEVSELINIKSHTLRFWEKEFKSLRPVTRKGGRRYYQSKDLELIKQIKFLLYEDGMTIAGAKKSLQSSKKEISGNGKEQRLVEELEDLLSKIN